MRRTSVGHPHNEGVPAMRNSPIPLVCKCDSRHVAAPRVRPVDVGPPAGVQPCPALPLPSPQPRPARPPSAHHSHSSVLPSTAQQGNGVRERRSARVRNRWWMLWVLETWQLRENGVATVERQPGSVPAHPGPQVQGPAQCACRSPPHTAPHNSVTPSTACRRPSPCPGQDQRTNGLQGGGST